MELTEFVTASEIAFERLMTPTKGLRPEVMEETMDAEGWSFKDLGRHLAEQNAALLRDLEATYHGLLSAPAGATVCGGVEAGRTQGMPLKRVMNEMRITHSAVIEAARRIDWSKLDNDDQIPDWLVERLIGHYDQHRPEVEAWVEQLKIEGRGPFVPLASLPVN